VAEVLGAQGNNKAIICDRCFASVKAGSDFCPECGAPLGNGPTEGSDSAVYTELARANLLRMRGDYTAAQEQCRAILHKFPNNVSANQLLGDICVETGDLEQAKEWYELALDIAPDSESIRQKLEITRQRIEHKETEGLVEQLGLPPTKPRNGAFALTLAALVVSVGFIAYLIGSNRNKTATNEPTRTTITAPAERPTQTTSNPGPTSSDQTGQTTIQNPPVSAKGAAEDRALAQLITQRNPYGDRLISLTQDPRSGLVILTYSVNENEDEKQIGAALAASAFDNSLNASILTVRAIRKDLLTYVADAHRAAYEETKSESWQSQNANDPTALGRHIFAQEWTPNGTTTPSSSTPNNSTDPSAQVPGP